MNETSMLARHGTDAITLPPSAIISTAINDLRTREYNTLVERGVMPGPFRRYAFLGRHVRRAANPSDLILRALKGVGLAEASTKVSVHQLYKEESLLPALEQLEGASAYEIAVAEIRKAKIKSGEIKE